MWKRLHVKYPLYLSDFNKTWVFPTDLQKRLKYQVSSKSVQWEPSCSMRTDRRTWRPAPNRVSVTPKTKEFTGRSISARERQGLAIRPDMATAGLPNVHWRCVVGRVAPDFDDSLVLKTCCMPETINQAIRRHVQEEANIARRRCELQLRKIENTKKDRERNDWKRETKRMAIANFLSNGYKCLLLSG